MGAPRGGGPAPGVGVGRVVGFVVGTSPAGGRVMGVNPPRAARIARGGRVGFLAQDAHIFATSVAENIRIGHKDATDAQVQQALGRARLDLASDRVLGEGGAGLSGGERRRLAFARVLVGDRDLLVLDEPTEHLDHDTAEQLIDDVFAETRDLAVLVLTHDRALIERCDRVVEVGKPAHR